MSKGAGGVTLRKYYVSMIQVLCQSPIDYITQVRVDKRVIFSGKFTGGILTINKPNLFGGMTREGGVSGNIEFQLGLPTQTASTFVTNKFGASPAYRRLVTAILENFYIGTNYYMKPISYVVTRINATNSGASWQPAYIEPIPGQMNGVHIIRDLLVDNIYGLGIDVTRIGSSFDSAAITTFNEGYGFSFFFNQEKTLDELIKTVKSHLNAELYIDRTTNKYEIKLVRQDYTLGSLLTLNASNSEKVSNLKRTLPGELFSKVVVQYQRLYSLDKAQLIVSSITRSGTTATLTTDRDHGFSNGQRVAIIGAIDPLYNGSFNITVTSTTTFTYVMTGTPAVSPATGTKQVFTYVWATDSAVESAEDIALSVRQGGVVQKKIQFEGVRDRFLAKKIALRELAEVATQIWVGSITCNRTAENLNIGDAFILSATVNKYLDSDIVCRVSTIDLGSSTNNKITINFVQDVFAAEENPIFITPNSDHVDPISVPVPVTNFILQEVPYYALAKSVGDAQAQSTPTTSGFIMMAAQAPSDDSINAGFWTNSIRSNVLTFSPYGTLGTSINKITTVLNITNQDNFIQAKVGQILQIDAEIMGIVSVSGAVVTVIRGCADTVPELHSAGANCFAWQELNGKNTSLFLLTEVVANRLTPVTPAGELPFASATNTNITIVGRQHLPYPPGNFQINGTSWITSVTLANLVLTWASRNRFQQTVTLLNYYSASVTSESSITYSAELRRIDTNAILLSFTGETLLTRTLTTLVNLPGTVISITSAGTLATFTNSIAHGLVSGINVQISGAIQTAYNGNFVITVTSATTFTYTMLSSPGVTATGTLLAKTSIYSGQVSLAIWSVNATGISFQKVIHIFNLT
jgi:hypothetical protein